MSTGKYTGEHIGNYELKSLMGIGSFGEVYQAKDLHSGKTVAIKLLLNQDMSREERLNFWKEAQVLAALDGHPNIVRVFEFKLEEELPYMVMEFAPGGSLLDRHPFSPAKVVSYTKQVAAALQYAHNANVVHHDVKPANLLIGAKGQVLLSDFGVAEANHSTRRAMSEVHQDGTPAYMPPEKIREGFSRRAGDQYSLAVMVYQWLTGRLPFQTIREVCSGQPPPSIRLFTKVSPEVEEVVKRGMAQKPEDRYPSVQDFAIALEKAAEGKASNPVRDTITALAWSAFLTVISLLLGHLGETAIQMNEGPGHATISGPNSLYVFLLVFGVFPLVPQLLGKVFGVWRGALAALVYLLAVDVVGSIALPEVINTQTMWYDVLVLLPMVPVAAATGFLYTAVREKKKKLGCGYTGFVSFAAAVVFWYLAILLSNGPAMAGTGFGVALALSVPVGLLGGILDMLLFNALLVEKNGKVLYPAKVATTVVICLLLIGGGYFAPSYASFGAPAYAASDLHGLSAGNTMDNYWENNGKEHINYISSDGHVHELFGQPGGKWENNDLTALSKGTRALIGSALSGYRSSGGNQHVDFIGVDRHIHELSLSPGGKWGDHDLTALSKGADPVSGSSLSSYQGSDGSEHLNFIGKDGHVHELYWLNGWDDNDLTALSRGVDPAHSSALSGYLGSGSSIHVNFIGKDGHVHELYWLNGWSDNDLTALSKGITPATGSTPSGYWGSDNSVHVNFIGKDGHVHELYWLNGWSDNDLTVLSKGIAPAADSRLSGYWGSDSSVHVNFVGTDGHVHELSIFSGGNWSDSDLTASSKGTAPAPDGMLTGYWSSNHKEYVNYISTNEHIYAVYSAS